jgi:zinc and cadmium transporter
MSTWGYTILSVVLVSLVSIIGIFTVTLNQKRLYRFLIYFVSFSAGTLIGDAFIHLIPEAFRTNSNSFQVSLTILVGISVFFILEKIVHWRHCHEEPCVDHPHPFSYMILFGDTVHNFIDGVVIAASYLVSVPLGVATTVAVLFHEIPQEIGDFGSLVYGGFTINKAILFNFMTALTAILGAVFVLVVGANTTAITNYMVPFAAGGFIYVASTDLIPELKKHSQLKTSLIQVLTFLLGIIAMIGLLVLE